MIERDAPPVIGVIVRRRSRIADDLNSETQGRDGDVGL
jgi:hypothetical protein